MTARGGRAILHIGMGKCGSSALQAALSANPRFGRESGPEAIYLAHDHKLRLIEGRRLTRQAETRNAGHANGATTLDLLDGAVDLDALARTIARHRAAGRDVVLSNEGWARHAARFAESRFVERVAPDAEIVVSVRPQVEWLNSAWWQWGAWSDRPFDRWMRRQRDLGSYDWHATVEAWKTVPGVAAIRVMPASFDVVGAFRRATGLPLVGGPRSNRTAPAVLLRRMQLHPDLRPGPGADFLYAHHLPTLKGKAPWVIDPSLAAEVIAETTAGNRALLPLMTDIDAAAVAADARWWDAAAFADRTPEPADPVPPDPAALEALAHAALTSLSAVDRQVLKPLRAIEARLPSAIGERLRTWLARRRTR